MSSKTYDVVIIDCPPQLGYLTLGALCAATGVLITVHPQMLDVASMSQFLHMTSGLLGVVRDAGGNLEYDFLRYLVTRYEPNDGPQTQIVGLLRSLFGDQVLTLADAHGLVVMAGRRIGACWSTDRHMGLTGVTLVT